MCIVTNGRENRNAASIKEGCILSWNCRGISNKKTDLQILIKEEMPVCLCIQETKLKTNQDFMIKNYTFTHKPQILNPGENAKGGVGIFIRNDIPNLLIDLNTDFQAIAIQTHLHKKITICCIYIPPDRVFSKHDLENLINQLPPPFILTGDFNSHNTLWFDKKTDPKGEIVEKLILENNICLLDKNKYTFCRGTSQTHVDLTLISPEIFVDFTWETYEDQCNSDHVPILLKNKNKLPLKSKPRWNLEKADWAKYASIANFDIPVSEFNDINVLCKYITDVIVSAATISIPMTKPIKGKISVPWWNGCCRVAVNKKKATYRRYMRTPTLLNYISYKKANAQAKKIVRESKRKSWFAFLAGINSQTPIKQLWSRVGSLKKFNDTNIPILKMEDNVIDKPFEIANTLAKSMSEIANFKNRSENFIKFKNENNKTFNFDKPNHAPYNVPITKKEILNVLKHCRNSATGDDKVHYYMLKNLSDHNQEYIRTFYNIIFLKHLFPQAWKQALIIPILKPDKDPKDPKSYRPISLLSCLFKVLDTIINNRIMWFLEKNNLLNKCQSGGRRGRSTMDHVGTIATEIQKAFATQKYHVSVFLDFENAYDKTWKQHILNELEKFKMKGNLPIFIQNYLANRTITVQVNNEKSTSYNLETGVPQGSSLSATLFLIAINNLVDDLSVFIRQSLFVDDCRISIICYDLETAKIELQKVLNIFERWCHKTGFSFSSKKSKVLICHRKRRVHEPKIDLFLNKKKLECVSEFKFLGVILDSKLNWIPQLKMIKEKTFSKINLLKIIASSKYKTNTQDLLNIYKALILPKIEYGTLAYHTAAPTYLKILDPIHHKCLRICLGAFRTTPINSLYVESNIPSLNIRRKIACIQYYFRNQEIEKRTISTNFQNPNIDLAFINRKKGPYPIGMTIRKDLDLFKIGSPKIIIKRTPFFPPWFIPNLDICFELNKKQKKTFTPEELKLSFHLHRHESRTDIFTDGSKTTVGTGAGVAIYSRLHDEYNCYKVKLNKLASVYTAELEAIKSGLQSIQYTKNTSCTIYSDSKSSLLALNQYNPKNELLKEIHTLIFKITQNKTKIKLCWIPGHCDIRGNELADKAAREAANITGECIKPISASDMKPHIKNHLFASWKEQWRLLNHNKLKNIGTEIGNKKFSNFDRRIEEIKFTRIRLGHTRLTHSFYLNGDEPPICTHCNVAYSIVHIILVCPNFYLKRREHFGNSIISIKELLNRKNTKLNHSVIEFFKSINLFSEI